MDIVKLICIGLVACVLFLLLKGVKSELSGLVIVCAGIVITGGALYGISGVLNEFSELLERSAVDTELLSGVIKVVGIGYVSEYAASICKDAGCESVGDKILFAAKVCIFSISLPLLKTLIELLIGLFK